LNIKSNIIIASDGKLAAQPRKITKKEVYATLRSAIWHYRKIRDQSSENKCSELIKRLRKNCSVKVSEIRLIFFEYYKSLVANRRVIAAENLTIRIRRVR